MLIVDIEERIDAYSGNKVYMFIVEMEVKTFTYSRYRG